MKLTSAKAGTRMAALDEKPAGAWRFPQVESRTLKRGAGTTELSTCDRQPAGLSLEGFCRLAGVEQKLLSSSMRITAFSLFPFLNLAALKLLPPVYLRGVGGFGLFSHFLVFQSELLTGGR
jgi:hypothetical protein